MGSRHDRAHSGRTAVSAASKCRGPSTNCIMSNCWKMLQRRLMLYLPYSLGCIEDGQLGPGYMDISIRAVFLLSTGATHGRAPSHSLDLGSLAFGNHSSRVPSPRVMRGLSCLQRKNGHYFPEMVPPLAALDWGCILLDTAIGWTPISSAASPSAATATANLAANSTYLPYEYSKACNCRQNSVRKGQKTPCTSEN